MIDTCQKFSLSAALLLLNLFQVTSASAQELRGPMAAQDSNTSTSVDEVLSGNPIQLRVTKTAPSGELPERTGLLSLDDAVQAGIKNNFTLKQSEQSWIGSKFTTRAALAKFGPSASFNTFYSSSSLNQMLFLPGDTSIASPPMQPIVRGSSLSLLFAGTQPLFTGGRLLGGYRAARAAEKQSLATFNEQRIQTALRVKETYWNAAWSEANLRVATDYVKFREWSSRNMKARVQEGKAPRADYLREEAELARARIQLNERYRDFNSALLNLKVSMAVNIGSQLALRDELVFVEIKDDLNKFLTDAASNRPELRRAAYKVAEMKARRQVAMSKYSPQVNAYGLGSNIKGSSPDGNANGRWGGFIGVMGGVTLFDSGSRLNELRAANAAVREADLAKRDAELKVAQEVSQAWIDLDLARRNVALAQDQVTSAEEDHRLFKARYEVGKSIALEQFDAAVKMFQARLTLKESIYKYLLAQARLTFASGGF
ncbi:MAG: TolC family protein [Candidatus Melainabacteria bacterium]|nr:MAG: TolC family protein [Candidatus Melainabacteria bacterium]